MLNRIKTWLIGDGGGGCIEQDPLGFTLENQVETMRATIVSDTRGFVLINADGNPIHTYSRRRDALRGAQRRGLQLA